MKDLNKAIKVSCDCKDTLKLSELTEFQGGLKERTDDDVDKIVRSIKKYGIAFPMFVWKDGGKNMLIDGHGRYKALHRLDDLGFLVPPLPVVYVDCKNEQGARDLLLRLNSHYGKMTKESVLEFIGDFEIDVSDLELPCGTIEFGAEEAPDISELDDDGKTVKDFSIKISFKSKDDVDNFLARYQDEIKDEYKCNISVSGGLL